jgi:hypothetical protein
MLSVHIQQLKCQRGGFSFGTWIGVRQRLDSIETRLTFTIYEERMRQLSKIFSIRRHSRVYSDDGDTKLGANPYSVCSS